MAPAATNGDAILDEIKAPAGIVIPPREIKAILEKTAGYVARNGAVFEDRIREKERSNPKFSFLSTNDAYAPYYFWRLDEIKAGRGNAIAAGRTNEIAPEEEKSKGPPPPLDFEFSARMPNISAQDLEIVRLTALWVAQRGKKFQSQLQQRETGNYQFDFLRANHSLHGLYQRLIDQYSSLLKAGAHEDGSGKVQQARMAELERNIQDKFHVLQRAKSRAEYFKWQDAQKVAKEEEAEKERLTYAQIDWHDFTIVETVLFTEADDQAQLPPPTALNDLQFASLDQKASMSINANLRIEEAFPSESDSYYGSYSSQPPAQMPPPQMPNPAQPAYQPSPQQFYPSRPGRQTEEDEEEEARIRERTEERARAQAAQQQAKAGAPAPGKIKTDYVPRAAARNANRAQMAICPNCKQQIPYNELDEHMRIELLDPRWKEQKAKADSRFATTNLHSSEAATNLKRLASQRSDVFDPVTGHAISEEEVQRRKKAATSYDGNPSSKDALRLAQMQNVNVHEQIRNIQEKYGNK